MHAHTQRSWSATTNDNTTVVHMHACTHAHHERLRRHRDRASAHRQAGTACEKALTCTPLAARRTARSKAWTPLGPALHATTAVAHARVCGRTSTAPCQPGPVPEPRGTTGSTPSPSLPPSRNTASGRPVGRKLPGKKSHAYKHTSHQHTLTASFLAPSRAMPTSEPVDTMTYRPTQQNAYNKTTRRRNRRHVGRRRGGHDVPHRVRMLVRKGSDGGSRSSGAQSGGRGAGAGACAGKRMQPTHQLGLLARRRLVDGVGAQSGVLHAGGSQVGAVLAGQRQDRRARLVQQR
jgi:hypothetical protein